MRCVSICMCVCVCVVNFYSLKNVAGFFFAPSSDSIDWLADLAFYKLNFCWCISAHYLSLPRFFFFDVAFPCSYATVHAFFIALTAAIMKPNGNWQMSRKCTSAHVGFQLESLVYASKAFDTANRAFWAQRKKTERCKFFIGRKILHTPPQWWQCPVV